MQTLKHRAKYAFFLSMCFCVQGAIQAQEGKLTLSAADAVRIELIAQPKEVELPSQFHIALKLVNATSESLIFRAFDLKSLEEPGGLKVSDECRAQVQAVIEPTSVRSIVCQLRSDGFEDSFRSFLISLLSSWSLVTLQPGDYRFVATAEFRRPNLATSTVNTIITVKIRPTIWQVCFGAMFGALMLVVFSFASPRTRTLMSLSDRLQTASRFRRWVFEPFALWIGASVASSIFIFLTYRLKDVSGPFTITVNDFYGGVVLGLFGVFLADWLAGKLFVVTTPNPGAGGSSAT